jgi:hypothetical protein
MLVALERLGLKPTGVSNVKLYHLAGRETTNKDQPDKSEFSLEYSNLSPYAIMEILDLNEAQQQRFLKAYDLAKRILMQLKIYPATDEEKQALLELDEMGGGYPRLALQMMYDIVRACAHAERDPARCGDRRE